MELGSLKNAYALSVFLNSRVAIAEAEVIQVWWFYQILL